MSNDLKRIDPAEVRALYQKHGMEPVQKYFVKGVCGCCVNTILAAEAVGLEKAVKTAADLDAYCETGYLGLLSGLDSSYAIGLAKGWDGRDVVEIKDHIQELGYRDGCAAWGACKSLLPGAAP
jgi:nitroreductase